MNINEPQAGMAFNLPGFRPRSRRITHRTSSRLGSPKTNRLPFLDWLPDHARNHFVAMSGEFAGTFLFLFFAFAGTQVANTKAPGAVVSAVPDPAALLYISLSFGFSLAVNAWVFFRISGGLFNPAGLSLTTAIARHR